MDSFVVFGWYLILFIVLNFLELIKIEISKRYRGIFQKISNSINNLLLASPKIDRKIWHEKRRILV